MTSNVLPACTDLSPSLIKLPRYETREGVDADEAPPLPQEHPGDEAAPSVGASGEQATTEEDEEEERGTQEKPSAEADDGEPELRAAAVSPSRSPAKRSRAAGGLGGSEDSGSWRVRGSNEEDAWAYLDTEFASDDGSGHGEDDDVFESEDARQEQTGRRLSVAAGSQSFLSDGSDSLEYEYETRAGVDLSGDAPAQSNKPVVREDIRIFRAHRSRTTGAICRQRPTAGGLDVVCDPVLGDERAVERCRRGARVLLQESYARRQGLSHCLGLVGILQRRAQVGIWNVLFPDLTHEVRVHVGDGSMYGLYYADSVPGLAAPAGALRREAELNSAMVPRSGLLKGGAPRVTECSRGCAPSGRRAGEAMMVQLVDGYRDGGGGQPTLWRRGQHKAGWLGGRGLAAAEARRRPRGTGGEKAVSDAEIASAQVLGEAVPSAPDGEWDVFALEQALKRFFSYCNSSKMKNAPELAVRYVGQERALCARLRRKYGVDVCSGTGELVAYKQAQERGAVLRQLAAHGGSHSAEQALQVLESMGQFFEWRQSLLEVMGAGGAEAGGRGRVVVDCDGGLRRARERAREERERARAREERASERASEKVVDRDMYCGASLLMELGNAWSGLACPFLRSLSTAGQMGVS